MFRFSRLGLGTLLLGAGLAAAACEDEQAPDAGLAETHDGALEGGPSPGDGAADAMGADGSASDSGTQEEAGSETDAGDAGDAGNTATTSVRTRWRLWDAASTTFAEHVVQGPDGERSNTIQCEVSGGEVVINIVDEGLDAFGQVVRPRSQLQLQLDRANDTLCSAAVREVTLGDTAAVVPEYRDSCSGGCTFDMTVSEDTAGATSSFEVEGTIRCTEMKDSIASSPLELAGSYDIVAAQPRPMEFHLVRCEAK